MENNKVYIILFNLKKLKKKSRRINSKWYKKNFVMLNKFSRYGKNISKLPQIFLMHSVYEKLKRDLEDTFFFENFNPDMSKTFEHLSKGKKIDRTYLEQFVNIWNIKKHLHKSNLKKIKKNITRWYTLENSILENKKIFRKKEILIKEYNLNILNSMKKILDQRIKNRKVLKLVTSNVNYNDLKPRIPIQLPLIDKINRENTYTFFGSYFNSKINDKRSLIKLPKGLHLFQNSSQFLSKIIWFGFPEGLNLSFKNSIKKSLYNVGFRIKKLINREMFIFIKFINERKEKRLCEIIENRKINNFSFSVKIHK